MQHRRLHSIPAPGKLELLGEGSGFRNTLYSMLAKAKCFEKFTQNDLELLADLMKAYRAPPDTTIVIEGEHNSCLCVLIEGRVGVFKEDDRGVIKHLASIMQGRAFGEISLIDDLPFSASVITATESVFLLMSRECFYNCVDTHPVLGVRLLRLVGGMLCQRLRATSVHLVDLIDV